MGRKQSKPANCVERVIRRYKSVPITTLRIPVYDADAERHYRTFGYIVKDRYKFVHEDFNYKFYKWWLKRKPQDYFYADFPSYLTNLLLNGAEIATDEEMREITAGFNKLPSDCEYSRYEVTTLEKDRKWELEDKRCRLGTDIYDSEGDEIFVSQNRFTLEII